MAVSPSSLAASINGGCGSGVVFSCPKTSHVSPIPINISKISPLEEEEI
jgi:hypothetical protein